MKWHNILTARVLTGFCSLGFGVLASLSPLGAMANTTPKATGELAMGKQATVDGQPATAGLTLFNNNRVATAKQGAAALNLGKQGRIEVGPETEFALRLAQGVVGGQLVAGRLWITTPAGVGLSVNTGKSTVIADGKQAATLMIESIGEHVRVVAHRGEAVVLSGTKADRVAAGDEVALNTARDEGWRHRRAVVAGATGAAGLAAGVVAASAASGKAASAAAAASASQTASLASLINAGISTSSAQFGSRFRRDVNSFFIVRNVCRNTSPLNPLCNRRSGF